MRYCDMTYLMSKVDRAHTYKIVYLSLVPNNCRRTHVTMYIKIIHNKDHGHFIPVSLVGLDRT